MAPPVTCECGKCATCLRRIYMREWYAKPENTQRHRETALRSRHRRIEDARAYDRDRGRKKDPLKQAAMKAVSYAVAKGTLVREPCERCGSESVEGHHDDYHKPLDVRWLCKKHHMEHHRTVNP